MRKKQVEEYIHQALKALEDCEIVSPQGIIAKEYKGYISSFGASIITNGLLPAIAFFQGQSGKKNDPNELLKAILYIINSKDNELPESQSTSLLDYVIKNMDNKAEIQEEIMAAAVALKLAMRTFQFSSEEADNHASA